MQITIDTSKLSELDINMLSFLADQGEVAEEPAPQATAPKRASRKKAAAKAEVAAAPEVAAEPEPAAAAPEPAAAEPEPEAAAEDEAPTMSDAVAAATKLVSSGQASVVKDALAVVGAKRVSEMGEANIATFLAALEVA
jgi:hypothetical protein